MALDARQIDLENISHIKELVLDIESEQNKRRKRNAWKLNQTLEGNQAEYTRQVLAETYPKTHTKFRLGDINIPLKVDNKISRAYKQSPLRSCTSENETKALESIYNEFKFQRAFKEADSVFNLHKYVCLWLTWQNPDPKLNIIDGSYVLHALKPYEYDLVRDQVTGEPVVFIQSHAQAEVTQLAGRSDGIEQTISESQSDTSAQTRIYYFWDKDFYGVYEVKRATTATEEDFTVRIIDIKPNLLECLPITYLQADSSVDYPVDANIAEQSIDWNVAFSDLKTAAATQGHGQLILTHPEGQKLKDVHMGMHTAISLPQSAKPDAAPTDAKYISANPDLGGQLEVLKFDIVNILDDHGIKAKGAIEGGTDKFSSGFDRLLSEADVQDEIEDNQSLYSITLEQGNFKVLKATEKAMNQKTFSENSELEVTFEKPKVLISDKETLDNIEKREELGLILPWEKHIIMNPNLTEEQAKKREEEIVKHKEEKLKKQMELMEGEGNDDDQDEDEDKDENSFPPKEE
jgi:hypothetical protein